MTHQDRPALVVHVEDSPDNQRLVQWVLERTGRYEVIAAKDGVSGLELVQLRHPDLVLIDLDIPLLDGFELARRILAAEELREIPLIAVSASVMQREQQRCLDEGFVAFIAKPFDVQHFRQVVDRQLRLRRSARADPPPAG